MKYCSSSRVHKTKRALYLRVSFLRNGGRVSLTKKNLQKMNFSAASLKKKKPMKIRQPKNKTLQKMSFSCVSLLLQQLRKKQRHSQKQQIIVQTIIAHISIFISTFCALISSRYLQPVKDLMFQEGLLLSMILSMSEHMVLPFLFSKQTQS